MSARTSTQLVRRQPQTWAEVRDWTTEREMRHAANLWREYFWAKGALAAVIAIAVVLPIAILVSL